MTGDGLKNIRLEKIYTLSADVFREGFTAYQKKFVYPKSYLFMAVFLVLALNFIYGAVKAPDNYFAYIMIVVCVALMMREWFNPRRIRRTFTEAVQETGGQEYKITVGDNEIEFSTIQRANVENSVETDEEEPIPPTVIGTERLEISEYDRFFLLADGKVMFYIVPKECFSDSEKEIIRNINKNSKTKN